jgi:hypothetical protein
VHLEGVYCARVWRIARVRASVIAFGSGKPPNPRVQRTRAYVSLWRSPLTLHPLGRCWALVVVVRALTFGTLACASGTAKPSESFDLGGRGVETLSGDWGGTFEVRQAGKCTVGLRHDSRWQGKAVADKYRFRMTVESDGSFALRQYQKGQPELGPALVWGSLDEALHISALRTTQAECNNVSSERRTKLTGQVARGPSGPVLEMAGREATCPQEGCLFDISYRLTREQQ